MVRLGNHTYRTWEARLLFFLKLTPMVRLGNHTYRTWEARLLFFLKLTPMVRFPNRTIGVNLGIFSSVFESVKGCVFSSTFLKSASMVKRLFYGFQSFAKCRF